MLSPLSVIVLVLACIVLGVTSQRPSEPQFKEVSREVGFKRGPGLEKNFGAAIGDLNRDGYPELILSDHHNGTELYWANGDGTYTLDASMYAPNATPHPQDDYAKNHHGFAIGDLDGDGDYDFLGAVKERRLVDGKLNLRLPYVGEVEGNSFTLNGNNITGINGYHMVGRTVRLMDMTADGNLDALMLNNPRGDRKHVVYQNVGGGHFEEIPDTGIELAPGNYGGLVDADGDGLMDIILTGYRFAELYLSRPKFANGKYVPNFKLDLGRIPALSTLRGGHCVLEVDYDGDGDLDIYIAAGFQQDVISQSRDILLENVDGKYIDVSDSANVPVGGAHIHATGGDFNNDGYVDILIARRDMDDPWGTRLPEILLLNRGNKSFRQVLLPLPALFPDAVADSVHAFDYNQDGKIDILLGEANGSWRLLENVGDYEGNFLQLVVGKHWRAKLDPEFNKETLGTLVTVTANEQRFVARIGSSGESHSQSYLEVLHFGLGAASNVSEILVKYPGGQSMQKWRDITINTPPVKVGLHLDYFRMNGKM